MKLLAVGGGLLILVVIGLLVVSLSQQATQANPAEVLAGVDGLVQTVADNDVRWLQQLMLAWDVSNRNYLLMAMPWSMAMMAAGVLGLSLLVVVVVLFRRLP